ncbi:hypothetical protein GCM10011416_07430 [Polaribacter pacificus]|uniref:Uncharacterized protein n=1 Tax=Polaribacter pacificus TaxID=1775173 RepID=A0A917HVG6_9FLAO|nr:hypothetical protein [Polaribacter pacificus]GGG92915.1 hypothetical protein GCM10011416_07430 [Polaribacter pacificus]
MTLTEEHIDQLYKFTRKHFVYHYDVQTELVDHLANDIEQIWIDQPQLSFEEGRDLSFKKFGVFGFMDVVEQKQKVMYKRYWKILWRFVKEWFTLPKAITTSMIFMLYFILLQQLYSFYVLTSILACWAVYDLIKLIKYKRTAKKRQVEEKRWLLKDMIGDSRGGFSIITIVNLYQIINIFKIDISVLSLYWLALIAALATLLTIVFYVSSIILPQKATELLAETYPEYKMQ